MSSPASARKRRRQTAEDESSLSATKSARTQRGRGSVRVSNRRQGTTGPYTQSPERMVDDSPRRAIRDSPRKRNTTIAGHVPIPPQSAGTWPPLVLPQVRNLTRRLPDSPVEPEQHIKRTYSELRARFRDAGRIIRRYTKVQRLTAAFVEGLACNVKHELCNLCRSLELSPEDFVITEKRNPSWQRGYGGQRDLGRLLEIYGRASECPLCRLVIMSLSLQSYSKLAQVVHGRDTGITLQDIDARCKITWQIDGREPRDHAARKSDVGHIHKTRRLCVEWEPQIFEKAYLVMVADGSAHQPPEFLGRSLVDMQETKLALISQWLRICSDKHGSDCQNSGGDGFEALRQEPYFGVIDVQEMKFTGLPEGEQYAALSYNWGQEEDDRFTTERSTVVNITKRNGLSHYLNKLPKTIRDTIELVRNLRIRYLWVDSICIVQDSPDAWNRNSAVMDLVYGNACLTICAADGENAHQGLRALDKPDFRSRDVKRPQFIEPCGPQLKLMVSYPPEAYIQQSKWNTRGWTFQERLLSKKHLIFTEHRVFWQCCTTTMCEEIDMETPVSGFSIDVQQSLVQDFKDMVTDPIHVYRNSVPLYTRRNLKKEGDVLNAFQGIGKLNCSQLGGEMVYGLPNTHFDWALLWEPEDAPKRRLPAGKLTFPSWSWCGWSQRPMKYMKNTVEDILDDLHRWLMEHTWITWYIRDGSGSLRLVWDAKRHFLKNEMLDDRSLGYSTKTAHQPGYDYYGRKIKSDMIGLPRTEFKRIMPDFPVNIRKIEPGKINSSVMASTGDWSTLQFFTWSTYFRLELENLERPVAGDHTLAGRICSVRYKIIDAYNSWVGTIVLDARLKFAADQPQHFIAISDAKQFYTEDCLIGNNYGSGKPWSLYNVLLLGYDDEQGNPAPSPPVSPRGSHSDQRIARRIGLGKVYKDAFHHGCQTWEQKERLEWREIILG